MTSHAMPRELERVSKGEYKVRGTELRIVQGADGKWAVQGHSDDLGAFGSRGAAFGKLQELGLVRAEQPKPETAPAAEQPKAEEPKAEAGKGRPTGRKARAKAAASA